MRNNNFDYSDNEKITPPTTEEFDKLAKENFKKEAEKLAQSPTKRFLHNLRMGVFFGDRNPIFENEITKAKQSEITKKIKDKK